jgi:hypothetical protein
MSTKLIHYVITSLLISLTVVGGAMVYGYLKYNTLPSAVGFCQFDCGWYCSIINSGYVFNPNAQSNVAFFPLFPYVWKFLGVSTIQIALFNGTLFLFSLIYVCYNLGVSLKSLFIFGAAGMITFFFVPYSESFFFAGTAFMLIGFFKPDNRFLMLGICLSIFTRSASLVFVVASFALIVFAAIAKNRKQLQQGVLCIALSIFCTIIVFAIQYSQTGIWNGFFISQTFWGFALQIPNIPFLQGAWPITLFDFNALLIGLLSAAVLVVYFFEVAFNIKSSLINFKKPLLAHELFSLLYLAGCTLIVVLFLGGSMRSLARFVFSTPFYLVFISLFIAKKISFNYSFLLIALCLLVVFLVAPKSTYSEHIIMIMINVIALAWCLFNNPQAPKKHIKIIFAIICIWGIVLQVSSLASFLNGEWMG